MDVGICKVILDNAFIGVIFVELCCSLLDTFVSGSPIIQNGRFVGAVTHVFVDDPTKGYGISVEEMLEGQ